MPLSNLNIATVVDRYIGVEAGNLSHFSFASLDDFFRNYCDITRFSFSQDKLGTKRTQLIEALQQCSSAEQIRILKGLLEKFHHLDVEDPSREHVNRQLHDFISELEKADWIEPGHFTSKSKAALQSLDACRLSLAQGRYLEAVDRAHTTLHGYLKSLCETENVLVDVKEPSADKYLVCLLKHRNLWNQDVPISEPTANLLKAVVNTVTNLGALRNKSTLAHPNGNLLNEAESLFAVNATFALLKYLVVVLGTDN